MNDDRSHGRGGTPRSPSVRRGRRRGVAAVLLALGASVLAIPPAPAALGEGGDATRTSVAAVNGVVVHGVESKVLAARVREIDQRLVTGDFAAAAKALADITGTDLSPLLEEGQGIYLSAQESVLQRVGTLPPDGLAIYRSALDPRADATLADAVRTGDANALARDAARFAYATPGPKLLLLLADLRIAMGDVGGAERALEDLLRLLDGHAPPETLAGAASRLAALFASRGDAPGLRGLAADLNAAALAAPSPLGHGSSLRDELARALEIAATRDLGPPAGPRGSLRATAEFRIPGVQQGAAPDVSGRRAGTLREYPLAVGTDERPALLLRSGVEKENVAGRRVVACVTPSAERPGADSPAARRAPGSMRNLWTWPSSPNHDLRRADSYPFAPARLTDDLVAFTWPAPPPDEPRVDRFADAHEERHQLVVLSLSAEGKLVEERGVEESRRSDGDAELESLSFCGRPCVDGRSVYVTAVRRTAEGDPTELHVCRFDLVPTGGAGAGVRLHLRWRRHVLDGRPMPPATLLARSAEEVGVALALPSSPVVSGGRVFVASNTGAVACLDATSGRPEWVETYVRFGPSSRLTFVESPLSTWEDVPLAVDGNYVFAAPADADSAIQYRRAPRRARSAGVETLNFAGPSGTASVPGRILPDLVATQVCAVRDGIVYLAGRVAQASLGATRIDASPFAAFRLDERRALLAQVQEFATAGASCLVKDAILLPTPKAIYRVSLDDFEGTPEVLWQNPGGGNAWTSKDRIGNLVPDGARLWSVTPTRVLLLEPGE